MHVINPPGFYNYFGTVTVKNDHRAHLALADISCEEVSAVTRQPAGVPRLQPADLRNAATDAEAWWKRAGNWRRRGGVNQ